jgi:internalin A
LTQLWLNSNQISVIPDCVGNLSQLTQLWLDRNQISVIPDCVGNLSQLARLDLQNNQIRELPEVLNGLPNLKELDLRGNPLSIPPDLLDANQHERGKRPAAQPILDYYFTTRDPEEVSYLQEAKLLIVGEASAGKTSLAQKLLNPDYALPPERESQSTQGIEIQRWEFIGSHGNAYRIHIWDFGGQEIYHQTHQFFLTDRSLYLLVADSRKEDTDHPYWLNIIRLLSNNSPVLLVQNEKQDRWCNLNRRELQAEFDALWIPPAINLADGRGLPDLRRTIQRQIEDLLGEGLPFPNKWLAVRHILENDSRNVIAFADYQAICRQQGIHDFSPMLSLSASLHSLGTCLHFQKDPILKHLLILKPNWGTAAVYKVLDNQRVKTNLGQFTDADLADIWSDGHYANLQHELLQLMKQFKVCYEIPRRNGHYIAPHLLNPSPPDYTWEATHSLTLRYEYKGFMPKGILTRFIVEQHKLIENVSCPDAALVWKTGVVLTKGNARAEIVENETLREIQIRVCGTRPRDLMTRINDQLEAIHDGFEQLDYDTLIPCNCTVCKPSAKPFLFPLARLYRCLDKKRYTIECHESGEDVQVRGLIDDVIGNDRDQRDLMESGDRASFLGYPEQWHRHRDRPPSRPAEPDVQRAIENHIHIHNANQTTNQQEQAMTESSKTNNFNGPMSGVIGSDNAQVSHNAFTQVNNADTAELLQLIATLRQTATTLPPDTQDAILIDLDDVEAEVQKPAAERNPKKLKQRLAAIVAAAGVAAGGVAGATDFANTAIDLGSKLGVELKLPNAP